MGLHGLLFIQALLDKTLDVKNLWFVNKLQCLWDIIVPLYLVVRPFLSHRVVKEPYLIVSLEFFFFLYFSIKYI